MIFIKHFDTSKQTLYGVGKVYVLRSSKVGDLIPLINERMRWTPGTPLKLYEVFGLFHLIVFWASRLTNDFALLSFNPYPYRKLNPV